MPQSVFAYDVTLNQPPESVPEGTAITFTGIIQQPCDDCLAPDWEPAYGVIVHIMDHTTDLELTSAVSHMDGKFSAQWTAQYKSDNYMIYAVAYWTNDTSFKSADYPLSVYQQPVNNIQLILNPPTPSAQVTLGDAITFSGSLVAPDKFNKRIKFVVDNIAILLGHTDQNGQFSITWKPESQYVGERKIYVASDEYEVKSESYDVNVLAPSPFTVKIVTDATSDTVPFWVNFGAQVDGGKEPYSFLWKLKEEIITTQSFNRQFVNVDEYLVTLTVTDSLSQTRTAQETIYAKAPQPPPLNPQIITNSKEMFEGSKISFFAEVKDPSRVKSYEWRVDGKHIGASDTAKFLFINDGSYLVSLDIIDMDGKQHSTSKSVSILNVPPQITSSPQNYEIEPGKALPLNVLYTDPGKEDNFTIEFFVDNQKIDTKFQRSPEFITLFFDYQKPGLYDAKIVVTDNDGGKDERNFSIVIQEPRFPIEIIIGIIVAAGGGGGYGIKKYLDTRNEYPPDLRIEIRVVRSGIER